MPKKIIDCLSLGGNHTRSVALDRDMRNPAAIVNYMVTPAAATALKQIGSGLAEKSVQRAWKVVGPYGSGKTALGVVLAQLSAGQKAFPAAHRAVAVTAPRVATLFASSYRFPMAIVGSRSSIGRALGVVAASTVAQWRAKPAAAVRRALDVETGTYKGLALNANAGQLVADVAAAAQAEGYGGVLLLIDEIGKFVEHAALRPDEGDLIALQQIAEQACTLGDDKLAVVVMLHQHFASYAAGVGRSLSDEWHKIASRFDEVAFDEPIERYAHFAAHAIKAKPSITENSKIADAANTLYSAARKLGVLQANSEAERQLFGQAEQLYPLHPLSIASLAVVSKRYGQSERSFHAFLRGNEPFGLRDFSHRHDVAEGSWLGLPEVFDYLAHGNGLHFRDLSAERRWAFALATLERQEFESVGLGILKSVAVFELVATGMALAITAKMIAFALGERDLAVISAQCDVLVGQGILLRRGGGAYAFAVSEAVNIEAVYEKAARLGEDQLAINGLSNALSQRLIVANKHYDETGTIRTMAVLAGSLAAWPKHPKTRAEELQPDAWLKLVLTVKGSGAEKQVLEKIKQESDQLTLSAVLALEVESRVALAEFAIWLAVQREVDQKRLDPWTSQYVAGRVQSARETIERLVLSDLMPFPERGGPQYWYQGRAVPRGEMMNLSQLASWLFSKVYAQAPILVNELINKDRPTSAIVLARQKMFEVILGGDASRPICAPAEFPPERLIHHTLLRQTGLWTEEKDRWHLTEPTSAAPINITRVWDRISELLSADQPPTFLGLLEGLAVPPLGIRAGPAGIWIAMYLLIRRSRCAVFERGSLVLEVTNELLHRMYKNPPAFELRELSVSERSRKLLHDYRTAITAVGSSVAGELTFLELARSLYRWYARLPEFSLQTGRISKEAALFKSVVAKAQDPIELLTTSLPKLHHDMKSNEAFADWLTHMLSELGMAHRKLQEHITTEICNAFEMAGPLSRVRNQLQAECAIAASDLGDARLKSFILRCTDLSLTDERWLDSIGGLIVHRPLDTWTDETIGRFNQELNELCAQYKRWLRVVTQRGKVPRTAERFVGVTLTMAGGQESSLFFAATEEAAEVARTVAALIKKETKGNVQLAASALAQALLDLQESSISAQQQEKDNGKRKTG
jgi:hypothetical protein